MSRACKFRAPVEDTVFGLSVFTVGGVVSTKHVLLHIVPEGSRLEAEVVVLNKDIGFVDKGQSVEVKLETFPFTRYGLIKGEVTQMSRDAVPDEKQGLVYKPVAPRAIDDFLSPFLRSRDQRLRER